MSSAEMNFCRRCGAAFAATNDHVYTCENGHVIFLNASPAAGIVLYDTEGKVLVIERALDPGKGMLDMPGGFCDGEESFEFALTREIAEEVGINADQYEAPQFVLSAIDQYDYKGETLPVLSVMFTARMLTNVEPHADDDAAFANFMDVDAVDLDKIYFPSVRKAFEKTMGEKR